jgi:hypothetical protein
MPNYTFISIDNPELEKDFFFLMKEVPSFNSIFEDENGQKWKRVPTIPFTSSNTKSDPFSSKDFVKKFENKNVKIGDISDASGEASALREQKLGVDPVKMRFFDDYSKKRRGINHPDDPRPKEAAKKRVEAHLNKTLRLPTS